MKNKTSVLCLMMLIGLLSSAGHSASDDGIAVKVVPVECAEANPNWSNMELLGATCYCEWDVINGYGDCWINTL